jgi:hypothetical protein
MTPETLPQKIRAFVDKFAVISPNTEEFNGPDPHMLINAADLIEQGVKPDRVWSEWGSGCYKPYSSKEGRELHDSLLKEIYNYQP